MPTNQPDRNSDSDALLRELSRHSRRDYSSPAERKRLMRQFGELALKCLERNEVLLLMPHPSRQYHAVVVTSPIAPKQPLSDAQPASASDHEIEPD